jgi:DNA-binding LytR/AlgR family response regulator
LPEELRGRVLYISAKDHHVEIVTETGRHVLRLRLADAIDEMEPVEGMCGHRSHWVARAAIAQVEQINAHKTQVHVINGDTLPVSRKYKVNLDKAGLTETSIAAS